MEKKYLQAGEVRDAIKKLNLPLHDFIVPATFRGVDTARLTAEATGAQLIDYPVISGITKRRIKAGEFAGKTVLVTEDISVSGGTLEKAKAVFSDCVVRTFVIAGKADYYIYEKPFCLKVEKDNDDKGGPGSGGIIGKLKELLNRWQYFLMGMAAFAWIAIRSGTNPKRLTYPCQQAAMPLAVTWAASVAGFMLGGFVLRRYFKASLVLAATVMSVYALVNFPHSAFSAPTDPLPVWEYANPVSKIFVVDDCPNPAGSLEAGNATVPDAYLNDVAMDRMVQLLEAKGQYFYKTAARPTGMFGSNDVVIIKGNFQGFFRNTTNTDRIKGLIYRLLNHPDGFTGEIIVADNTQLLWGNPVEGLNAQDNNSYFQNQDIVNVCDTFKAKGYPVSYRCWASISDDKVTEYNTGNMNEGYVQVNGNNNENYPKFTTADGKYLSLRYGVWNQATGTYDNSRLSVINFPVLKAHNDLGAITCALKNWVGMLTCDAGFYTADRHAFFWEPNNLVPRTHVLIRPKINFVDAEWVARTGPHNAGDVHTYAGKLLASTDPAAIDWYASTYLLWPISNNTAMNASQVGSGSYNVVNNSANYLNANGFPSTINPAQMCVYAYRDLSMTPTWTFTPSNTATSTNTWDPAVPTYTPTPTATPVPQDLFDDFETGALANGVAQYGNGSTLTYAITQADKYEGANALQINTTGAGWALVKFDSPYDGGVGYKDLTGALYLTFNIKAPVGTVFFIQLEESTLNGGEGERYSNRTATLTSTGAWQEVTLTLASLTRDQYTPVVGDNVFDMQAIKSYLIQFQAPGTQIIYLDYVRFTGAPVPTATGTLTYTATATRTNTATNTSTTTFTATSTNTTVSTATHTNTNTATSTATSTGTNTAVNTETATATGTNSAVPTATGTSTAVSTATATYSSTPADTATATGTATQSSTATETGTQTETPAISYTPTGTYTFTLTFTETVPPTFTTTATDTTVPVLTSTHTASVMSSATSLEAFTATNTATRTETAVNTATNTNTVVDTATGTPTIPVPTATGTAASAQTATPTQTSTGIPALPTATATEGSEFEIPSATPVIPFPNPCKLGEDINIRFFITQKAESGNVRFYTASYRLVRQAGIQSLKAGFNTVKVQVSGFAPGTYYYIIAAKNAKGETAKSKTGIITILK